jgi:peptidoglycan L-alanyl-D-glutamate endopeptidase CwlK
MDEKSRQNLSTCDPILQTVFNKVDQFIPLRVIEGHRSPERQKQLYEEGRSKVLVGKHNTNPSDAVDVAPLPVNWKDTDRFKYFAGFVIGMALDMGYKLRWGGDWDQDHELNDQTFMDLVHYEVVR